MARHRPILNLGWSFADHDRVDDLSLPRWWLSALRSSVGPPGTQMLGQFPFQATTGLDEQRQIDRLVAHLHLLDARVRVL